MKKLIFILPIALLSLINFSTFASPFNVEFRCTAPSVELCEEKTLNELESKTCEVIEDSVSCEKAAVNKKAFYCSAQTNRCADAGSDGFIGIDCNPGTKVKIDDHFLSATWSKGLFKRWVKTMCKMD
ncbi:MAG: hypothetical protein A2381_05425 [Bdellovibrionales bacterium RIFOXYB1_FULL_37_110]|nr:MAG: hypothetical protein A2417_16905 [Bdellovibrionales bacterium RIFOXYC1_FULL_37_79]OFZ58187.1 MAG: hypothetical protein A2381_05425 [Bdellovibrionales bacterium RIFOXYB1_FULL_37_110]OFZ61876.1 MAG: hypothetical protein A2577_19010 [Bdellovibrionales bacterium RIFOXYD1_FULL_36_51]